MSITVSASAQQATDGRARSLALFKESAAHYEAGRYSVAAALLEEAYALHPEPKLLYNLGRAREAGGEVQGALQAYETYLQMDPASSKRAEVEGRLDELRARAASAPAAVDEPTTNQGGDAATGAAAGDTPQTTPVVEPEAPAVRRAVPWVLVGAGGGILAAALTVGILARAQAKDAEREPSQAEAAKLQSAAERKALAANVLGGAGGALLIAGGAWLVFGGRTQATGTHGKNLSWSLNVGASNVDCLLRF